MTGKRETAIGDSLLAALDRPVVAAALLAILFAVLALRAAPLPADDCDVWWLAAAGRDLLAAGAAPRRNAYSYTDPDHPWVLHEMLPAIANARGLEWMGPSFFPLLGLLAGALTWAIVVAALLGRATRTAPAVLLALLALSAERGALFAPRPSHMALVLAAAMTALAFRRRWSAAVPVLAIVLEVLWANAHGSFPLGIALLLACAADEGLSPGERRLRLMTVAAAAVGSLLNPYGLALYGLVARYLFAGDATARIIREQVAEFAPLWRGRAPYVDALKLATFAMMFIFSASALARRRHVARAIAALGILALATAQVRHVSLAIVVAAVLLGPEVEALADTPPRIARPGWWWAAVATVPGLVLALALWAAARGQRPQEAWIADGVGGRELAALADALPDGSRVYAPFQSAGVVIWLGSPRGLRVFYDSRNDCYSPETAAAAFALESAAIAPGPLLAEAGTDFALAQSRYPVDDALARDPAWELWRREGDWAAYRPSSSTRAALPARSRR